MSGRWELCTGWGFERQHSLRLDGSHYEHTDLCIPQTKNLAVYFRKFKNRWYRIEVKAHMLYEEKPV
jgi:hypothetical protein